MNILYTFLFDIKRISVDLMKKQLIALIRSLNMYKNTYKLIIYTNVPELVTGLENAITIDNTFSIDRIASLCEHIVCIETNLDDVKNNYPEEKYYKGFWYNGNWLNLSFHKLIKYFEVQAMYNCAPIWIDLDTLVFCNIDHLADHPNFFIQTGTKEVTPHHIFNCDIHRLNTTYVLPANKTFQGNIWKLDLQLATDLLALWNTLERKPQYDLQDLFNYSYYFVDGFKSRISICGVDFDTHTVNGLDNINDSKITHPDIHIMRSNFIIKSNTLYNIQLDRAVQFFTFTFYTLIPFIANKDYKKFINNDVVNLFTQLYE